MQREQMLWIGDQGPHRSLEVAPIIDLDRRGAGIEPMIRQAITNNNAAAPQRFEQSICLDR